MHTMRSRYRVHTVDLDDVAAEVNGRFADGGLDAAEAVGEYLLQVFFNGSPTAFRNREGHYEAFRELTQRSDLAMSYSFLWTSIAVAEQIRAMPDDLARRLPLAHHRALLTIKDPDLKIRTARYAVEHGLSKRELEQRVRRVRPDEPTRGRRRLPELERASRGLTAALKHLREVRTDPSTKALARSDGDRVAELLAEIEASVAELDGLAKTLRAHLDEV